MPSQLAGIGSKRMGRCGAFFSAPPLITYPAHRPLNRRCAYFCPEGFIRLGNLTRKDLACILIAAIAFLAVYIGALAFASGASVAQVQPVRSVVKHCKTVTPQTFNRRVKVLDSLTGKRHHKASRKVCKSHFKKLVKRIARIKRRLETDVRYAIRKAFAPLGRVGEALSVSYCESSHNRFSINASNHAGLFQLSTEHQRYLKFGPWHHAYSNAYRAAEIVRADGGWGQWVCKP